MSRRKARIAVLQALYADANVNEIEEHFTPLKEKDKIFAKELFDGVKSHQEHIDSIIKCYSTKKWQNLYIVDKNILRLAVYELLFCKETPYKVVINEAIELAKTFGGENTRAFINAVLDKVKKDERKINSRSGHQGERSNIQFS
ncbi:MAG: transcription antitermination factor NusB [Deltaproteobacteria bacterium]|nr:transcription antitermination factor NusB [Deltaproteobacteria bacterium]